MLLSMFENLIKVGGSDAITYGLRVRNSSGKLLRILHDVSDDRDALLNLVYQVNSNDVELVHLEGIIEDFYMNHC